MCNNTNTNTIYKYIPILDYKGELLAKVIDLADRLLPAFNTPSRIPVGMVSLSANTLSTTNKPTKQTNYLDICIFPITITYRFGC